MARECVEHPTALGGGGGGKGCGGGGGGGGGGAAGAVWACRRTRR
jgi:hypothetical protein